jgi:hypothetical protein
VINRIININTTGIGRIGNGGCRITERGAYRKISLAVVIEVAYRYSLSKKLVGIVTGRVELLQSGALIKQPWGSASRR